MVANIVDKTIETPSGRFFYGEAGSGPDRLLVHSLLTQRTSVDQVTDLIRLPVIAHAPQVQDPVGSIKAARPFLEGK
jgi:hypothetical protein